MAKDIEFVITFTIILTIFFGAFAYILFRVRQMLLDTDK
jgi:hypothetical protein